MIIVRSPLRITLGGGGTDLPSYYRDHGGFLVAAAIDKYVYITLHKTFQPGYILKYSELERVERPNEIKHPIVRAAIELVGAADSVEIASMADIPAGTGLGSSGSFTTALLRALHTRQRNVISPHTLANQACHIEIELLREPVGKQDQFIAAYGGVTCFEFNSDDSVTVNPAPLSSEVVELSRGRALPIFHRLHAVGFEHPERSAREIQGEKRVDHRQPALCQRSRSAQPRSVDAWGPAAVRRANG